MRIRGPVDELGRDTELAPGTANASLEEVANVEHPRDFLQVARLLAGGRRRVPRNDAEPRDAGKIGGQLLCEAVREIRVVGIGREVVERQHDDGPIPMRRATSASCYRFRYEGVGERTR